MVRWTEIGVAAALLGACAEPAPETPPPATPEGSWHQIAVGLDSSCALSSEGKARCWGGTLGAVTPPSEDFVEVDVGIGFACGLSREGKLQCWGDPRDGQLEAPTGAYSDLDLGDHHGCALSRMSGQIRCWGTPRWRADEISVPVGDFVAVTTGGSFDCALDVDGAPTCWGLLPRRPDRPLEGRFLALSAGEEHVCGVTAEGAGICAGTDSQGQATPPVGNWRFVKITSGEHHSCGLESSGAVTCWGQDRFGETRAPRGSFAQVAVGYASSCGILVDGSLQCWGSPMGPEPAGVAPATRPQ